MQILNINYPEDRVFYFIKVRKNDLIDFDYVLKFKIIKTKKRSPI